MRVFYCLSNIPLQDHKCTCPHGTPHGSAWGARSSYTHAPGSSSLRRQHEVAFLNALLREAVLTRPPRRSEAPSVPDSQHYGEAEPKGSPHA
eukprot:2037291-Lingulodinium_polyedra.AAC.1